MKKKVQAFMMWFFTLLLLFSFQSWAQPEFDITTLINKTGADLPTQIGSGGNARAAALFQGRYVIVASREGGPNVWVWDSFNPAAAPFALPMGTDIINTTITFPINYVRVAGDAIYVSNLSLNPTGTGWGQGPFYIYRWTSLVGEPEIVLNFTALEGRLGDAFSIIGDPMGDGHIIAHVNTTKNFRVWNFEDGVLLNHDTPDLIVLDVPEAHINNHGIFNSIPGEDNLYIVTSNNKGLMIANLAGEIFAEWGTELIDQRTYDPNIFYLGGKRYLTYTLNNEGNPEVGARYKIVDISEGNTIVEAFEAITTSNELAEKIVHDFIISPTGHASLTGINSVAVLDNGDIRILAHVVGKGFVVEELSALSAVFFEEDFNDGNAASRWTFVETGGTNVVDFAFDYVAAGIPAAKDGDNGIGLKMATNTTAPGIVSAVMAFPNGQSFDGEYVLSFDLWMNYEAGSGGTTEHAIFGAGHTSTAIQTPAAGLGSVDGTPGVGPSNNGVDYTMTPDNGAARDVRVFVDGAELLGAAGGFADPTIQSTQAIPYINAYTGESPGNQWLAITIEVLADRTIFKVNGQVWAETMVAADPGNIMLGYMDFWASVANANSYIVFDNIKVAEKEEEELLARVQLIHNSADLAVASVDLYVNGDLAMENVAFRSATPFDYAPAGVDIDLVITPSGSPIEDGVALTVSFEAGKTYVVVAAGNVSATGYDPVVPFELFVYDLGREAAVNPANVDVLAFHGSTDAPTVTVWETGVGAGQLIADFEFGDFAGYLSLPLNDYILEIRDETGTVKVAAYEAPLATLGLQGQALTVLASGFLNPDNNSDGPAFGLYVALAGGGPLVELPFYDDTVIIDEFPYVQDFESGSFDGTGYVVYNVDGSAFEWVVSDFDNHTPGGQYSARHRWNTAGPEEGWLVSPVIVIPEDAEFVLSFWSRNQWAAWYGKNSVLISTGSADPADGDFVEIWSPESVVDSWVETVLDLSDYAGETIYLAFVYEGDDAHGWFLDDIYIGEPVALPAYATLFEFSVAGGDLPDWFGANNERGIATHGDNLYAVSRTGGNFVYVLDRITGAVTGQLNTTGIQSVGTFHINDIEASDDGVIVAANMAMGGGATFILYEMDETDPATPILQFTLPTEGGRIGDKITLVGSFADGGATLYAADAQNPKVYKWTLTGGVFGTPEVVAIGVPQGNTPVVSPLPDGTFYYTAAGQGLSKLQADGTLIGTVPGEIIPTGSTAIKYFGMDGNDEMIGVYLYGDTHEHLAVVRVVNGDPELAEIEFITPSMYGAANGNGTGDVAFEPAPDGKNVDLYVLGTNNGIAGYRSLMLDLEFPDYSVEVPPTFDVTFNVNMTYADGFDPAADVVYLTGSIFGWAEPGTQPENQTMSRVGETMIWTKTIELEAGTYAYKYFLNAGWGGGEWQGGDDRSLSVTGDMTVNDWFGYLTDPTSVSEIETSSLKLYPNPARTVLNIVSADMIRELRVTDMLGQVVYAADVVGESHQINVAGMRNGIYFVQILTSQGITTQKVQIQR